MPRLLRLIAILLLLSACNLPMPQAQASLPLIVTATPGPTVTATATVTVRPTATAQPSLTPTPTRTSTPAACADDMEVLLTYGLDQATAGPAQVMAAHTPGQAGWRLRNTGACVWDTSYGLAPDGSALTIPLPHTVLPGEWVDVSVYFRSPQQLGESRLAWELHDGRGDPVGPELVLALNVADIPADVSADTSAPPLPPGLSLRAYPDEIFPGEQTIVSWNVAEAKAVYFYPAGQNWRVHPVKGRGDFADTLFKTTTYELRVVRGDDHVDIYRVRVEVIPFEPPSIPFFRAKWEQHIENQLCVRLEWKVTGRAAMVNIFRNGAPLWIDALESGVARNCVPAAGVYTYAIQAIGPGGEVWKDCTVHVGN